MVCNIRILFWFDIDTIIISTITQYQYNVIISKACYKSEWYASVITCLNMSHSYVPCDGWSQCMKPIWLCIYSYLFSIIILCLVSWLNLILCRSKGRWSISSRKWIISHSCTITCIISRIVGISIIIEACI